MNQSYTLHDDTANRLYVAAMLCADPEVQAAGKTLAAQNPEIRIE
jgi:hypothetical protein